ncbi:MAG: aminotransferase class I/II-fold pyridoxal phosphate-dependent enzyme [Fimbriimonadales bacterium]|nr:aminotransferase class I/II-fold pyridoxal phosphate-dependent enzyme [Fimbriimonadales bacterium]
MIVDLRSDTVTRPTQEMYEAMVSAPLGDDVLGDEPTVAELETLAAETLGKEAAVFVPSGTMGNQIAVLSWTRPGDAILIEQDAHILFYESGGPGAHAGVVTWTLPSDNGAMDPNHIEDRITSPSMHTPATKLLCLENTHNRCGGTIIPQEKMRAYREIADRRGVNIHLDGARIFNAAVAQGIAAKEIAQYADSVNFCLSKGLSCPVGSVLTGPADFIQRARQHRKRMGGSMRQAGVLAACGVYALRNLVERLADDHARAKRFANELSELPGVHIDMATVQTNMVMVHTEKAASDWAERLYDDNVWCFAVAPNRLRCVFHREIDDAKLEQAVCVFRDLSVS